MAVTVEVLGYSARMSWGGGTVAIPHCHISPNASVTPKADAFERHTPILVAAEREDVAVRRQLAGERCM